MTDLTATHPELPDGALWPAALERWLDGRDRTASGKDREARPAPAEYPTRAGQEPRP